MRETAEEKRRRLLGLAREAVSEAYSTGEHAIIQGINAYNEIEKARNLLHERLGEWYGIYFPELNVSSYIAYAKLVGVLGRNKGSVSESALEGVVGKDAARIKKDIERSIGKDPEEKEYEAIRNLANMELMLIELENNLDSYLKVSVEKALPNVSYLVDYKIAAELLGKAGSLSKLANMPASTVQLLGAEKALFRHIKYGSRPPKYGVLFRQKEVVNARKENRGKIARLLATKISIAARADAFSKRFIGKELKQQIDKMIAGLGKK